MELEYVLQEVEEGMLGRLTVDVGHYLEWRLFRTKATVE